MLILPWRQSVLVPERVSQILTATPLLHNGGIIKGDRNQVWDGKLGKVSL